MIAAVQPDGLGRAIAAVREACKHVRHEIVIAHAEHLTEPVKRWTNAGARTVSTHADPLVPELWAAGFRAASGNAVAFTTADFTVPPTWAQALLSSLGGATVGAGGAIQLRANAGLFDRAVYFLRVSSFLPPLREGTATEIPGECAAYIRSALERHQSSFGQGFWEVDFHRRIREEGCRLVCHAAATVTLQSGGRWRTALSHRYRHGQNSGAYRAAILGYPWWRGVLAAPLVPLVLAARVLRRAGAKGRLAEALGAVPVILVLATAWAAGEAVAAWRSR